MTDNPNPVQFTQLVEAITKLIDEIKLLNLNLTVANARLRLTDDAFRLAGTEFGKLLDTTGVVQETAEVAVKKATGEELSDEEQRVTLVEMNLHLERVKQAAENIVSTVVSLKKGSSIDKEI